MLHGDVDSQSDLYFVLVIVVLYAILHIYYIDGLLQDWGITFLH